MGQSQEVSPHPKDHLQENPASTRGERSSAREQIHWLDDSSTRKNLGSRHNDQPASPEAPPLAHSAKSFQELKRRAFGKLWRGGRSETPKVPTDSKAAQVSETPKVPTDSKAAQVSETPKVPTDSKAAQVSETPKVPTDSKAAQVSETIERDMTKINRGKTLSDGGGKIEKMARDHHQDLFNRLKAKHEEIDLIEKDIKGKGVEHDDYSRLSGQADELKKEIDALKSELDEGPLQEEVRTWYREQKEEMERHQNLFNQFKEKDEELDRINEELDRIEKDVKGKGVEHDDHSLLSGQADKLRNEITELWDELEKGPLKGEVRDWYKEQYQKHKIKHHQRLFSELKAKHEELGIKEEMIEKDVKGKGVEHDDHSLLSGQADKLRNEITALGNILDKGPLKGEVLDWYKKQKQKDEMKRHQRLFSELKAKHEELGIKEEMIEKDVKGKGVEYDDHSPLSGQADKLIDEMDALGEKLDKGPLKGEFQDWYKKQKQKDEMKYHQNLFSELKEREKKLEGIDRNSSEKTLRGMEEQDDNHSINQEKGRVLDAITSLKEELKEGPLQDEVLKWYEERDGEVDALKKEGK